MVETLINGVQTRELRSEIFLIYHLIDRRTTLHRVPLYPAIHFMYLNHKKGIKCRKLEVQAEDIGPDFISG